MNEVGDAVDDDGNIQEMAADLASGNLAMAEAAVSEEEVFHAEAQRHRESDSFLFPSEQIIPNRSEYDQQVSGDEEECQESGPQEHQVAQRIAEDDIRTTDRAWLSFLGLEQRIVDVVPEPIRPTLTNSSQVEASELLSSSDMPEHGQAATPRGVPSEFSNTLLSLAGVVSPQDRSNRGQQRHQIDFPYHVSAVENLRPKGTSRNHNATKMDDPNDVWRRFVFGSDETGSESERAAGATSYAVTLHHGDKTPSPNSVEGQCSTRS